MPLYEYECKTCKHEWEAYLPLEVKEKMEEKGLAVPCPNCDSEDTIQVFTRMHFRQYDHILKPPPFLDEEGKEIDFRKQDVFGRKWSELSDEDNIESRYHGEVDEIKKRQDGKIDPVHQMSLIEKHYGRKRLKEKGVLDS